VQALLEGVVSRRVVALPVALRRMYRRSPTMVVAGGFFLAMVLVAILAPWVATDDPNLYEPINRLQPPSASYWLGSDALGRDVYSRVVFGTRLSLALGFSVALLVGVLGCVLGLLAGYYRRVDNLLMRFMDGLMAFPGILLALAIMAALGFKAINVVIALSITLLPGVVRVVRSSTLSLREWPFVEAARAIGARDLRILWRHVFPNVLAPLLVVSSYNFAITILLEAALSFLGVGPPPTTPTWGNIISEGRDLMSVAYWISLFPGVAIALAVLSLNVFGDGLRDFLDPKLAVR